MGTRPVRIVAVDDDEPNLRLYRLLLERHINDCTAVMFSDPLDALAYFEHGQADVALIDYDMPHLNGIQLAGAVRAMPDHAAMRMVMVTSHADEAVRSQARSAGIESFVEKPFELETLIRAVNLALHQPV